MSQRVDHSLRAPHRSALWYAVVLRLSVIDEAYTKDLSTYCISVINGLTIWSHEKLSVTYALASIPKMPALIYSQAGSLSFRLAPAITGLLIRNLIYPSRIISSGPPKLVATTVQPAQAARTEVSNPLEWEGFARASVLFSEYSQLQKWDKGVTPAPANCNVSGTCFLVLYLISLAWFMAQPRDKLKI